jgi:hypothetical protein
VSYDRHGRYVQYLKILEKEQPMPDAYIEGEGEGRTVGMWEECPTIDMVGVYSN